MATGFFEKKEKNRVLYSTKTKHGGADRNDRDYL